MEGGMDRIFKDLLTNCWWSWVALLCSVITVAITLTNPALSLEQTGMLWVASYTALCVFFSRPLILAACSGHQHLLTVCLWSFVLVFLLVLLSYYSFYAFVPPSLAQHYGKFLNIVPVFVAIWAAALGWFVHFRLSTKAHRTNNAFQICMEMRKSGEYLKRAEMVSLHFPSGTSSIPQAYHPHFPADSLQKAKALNPAQPLAVEMAEALQALRYQLNYFEFMAVGIKAGDLDEELLYNSISVQVVKLFERSSGLILYINADAPAGAGQRLAFCELRALVNRWKPRLESDTASYVAK
jgi:hypothetical protein